MASPYLPTLHGLDEVQSRLSAARQELADEHAELAVVQRIAARLYRRGIGAERTAPEQLVAEAAQRTNGLTLALRRERIAALADIIAGFSQLEVLARIRDLAQKAEEAAGNGNFVAAQKYSAECAELRVKHRDLVVHAEREGIAP